MKLTVKNIDLLNIILLIISGILAYIFPLELFLFSFAILGPLHYLTEINWLNTKNYFTSANKKVWLSIGIIASCVIVIPKLLLYFSTENNQMLISINSWTNAAIFICLVLAISAVVTPTKKQFIIWGSIACIAAILLNQFESYSLFIGVLIPTVIHVYLFTLIFMLSGAKRSRSLWGYMTVFIAILIPIIMTFISLDLLTYSFNDHLKSTYIENSLYTTPVLFAKFFGLSDGTTFFFYEDLELRLMMFMSFIYLYHYLNWFSKTRVISWHKDLNLKKTIIIISLWFILMSLFYFNYKLGFLAALFFSFLHVFLEFPLNIVSIKALFDKS